MFYSINIKLHVSALSEPFPQPHRPTAAVAAADATQSRNTEKPTPTDTAERFPTATIVHMCTAALLHRLHNFGADKNITFVCDVRCVVCSDFPVFFCVCGDAASSST